MVNEHPDSERPFAREFLWFWHNDRANASKGLKATIWITGNDNIAKSCGARRRRFQRRSRDGVVSVRVIQEFSHNVIKQLAFTSGETIELCSVFADCTVVKSDLDLVIQALRLAGDASISFWDACVVAAAERAQCTILYTEDLNSGQKFGHVRVSNPFI